MQSDSKLRKRSLELKFTNSPVPSCGEQPSNPSGSMDLRSDAALRLYRTRITGLSQRWTLGFLLALGLFLSWLIGYFHASPALLVLLGVAAIAVGRGRWHHLVEGVRLEAELNVRKKLGGQRHGESTEWLNFALNRWWTTCNVTVLDIAKDYVEPLLAEILPIGIESIEVVDVDFGEQTPTLSNVCIMDPPPSRGRTFNASTRTFIASFDLTVPSPDSQIVLRARVGSKNVGCNHLVYVEGLYLSGSLQAVVTVDNNIPFPHIIKITATFISKPEIWFSVKVLKGLRVTKIPLLKTLIHSIVMDMFTTLLVDPGRLTVNFDPTCSPDDGIMDTERDRMAQGVITIRVKGSSHAKKSAHEGDPRRWISLRLGQKKYQWQLPQQKESWHTTYSFLVYDLTQDLLIVKVKLRRMVYNSTLAVHSLDLSSLGLVGQSGQEASTNRLLSLSNSEVDLGLAVSYTPLPSLSVKVANGFPPISSGPACGVLYVHVHGGEGLMGCDSNGLSDPYCIIHANKHKVLRTPYVQNTLKPTWEKGVELFVSDISQVVLIFLVMDWDGPLVGDDLMGVAKLSLSTDKSELIQHSLKLVSNINQPDDQDLLLGHITVSVIFRPVFSVGQASPECHVTPLTEGMDELVQAGICGGKGGVALGKEGGRKVAKLLKNRQQYMQDGHMTKGLLEVQVVRGRDLVPKDSNGLSDPYVVIKYGTQQNFRSKVMKKTLNPEWNETVTLPAPSPDDIISVECWDKDVFSDDFMGSIQFTDKDLQIFADGQRWCKLDHVKSGELLLRLALSEEGSRWSHLDEASRQLMGQVEFMDEHNVGGTMLLQSPSERSLDSSSLHSSSQQDSSDASMSQTSSTIGMAHPIKSPSTVSSASTTGFFAPNHTSGTSHSNDEKLPPPLKRRHTLSHSTDPPKETTYKKYEQTTNPSQLPRYPETTADIERALNRGSEGAGAMGKSHTVDRSGYREKQITVYHNVSGQVVEATGLKGELDHLELYVKIRLNTRPSYQRQHKFGRGPVVHKTRTLRGSHSPQWREDFMVKESPVPSDALLTLDLKSGSKVNIGTYAITLDKFFDGKLKATRSFNIGNDVKLRVKLSRQLH